MTLPQPNPADLHSSMREALRNCGLPPECPIQGSLKIGEITAPVTAILTPQEDQLQATFYPQSLDVELFNSSSQYTNGEFTPDQSEIKTPISHLSADMETTILYETMKIEGFIYDWSGHGESFTNAQIHIPSLPKWSYPPMNTITYSNVPANTDPSEIAPLLNAVPGKEYKHYPFLTREPNLHLETKEWELRLTGVPVGRYYADFKGSIRRKDRKPFSLEEFNLIKEKIENFLSLINGDYRYCHSIILTNRAEKDSQLMSACKFLFPQIHKSYELIGQVSPPVDTSLWLPLFPAFIEATENPLFNEAVDRFWRSSRIFIQGQGSYAIPQLISGLETLYILDTGKTKPTPKEKREYLDNAIAKENFPYRNFCLLDRDQQQNPCFTASSIYKYRNHCVHPKADIDMPAHQEIGWLWLRGIAWSLMYDFLKALSPETKTLL